MATRAKLVTPKSPPGAADLDWLCLLHRGGFGAVCAVRNTRTGLLMAVKLVARAAASDDDDDDDDDDDNEVALLQCLAKTPSPFVVRLLAYWTTPRFACFALPLGTERDLMTVLQDAVRLPEAAAVFVLSEVLSGLQHLHALGILYRDLSLANTVVMPSGHIMLADLGVAVQAPESGSTLSIATGVTGALDFVSPDMLRGDGYGWPSDLWAFGVLAYELLVGRPPFWLDHDSDDATADPADIVFGRILDSADGWSPAWEHEQVVAEKTSDAARDLVLALLRHDPAGRLTAPEAQAHPFFASILDWSSHALAARIVDADVKAVLLGDSGDTPSCRHDVAAMLRVDPGDLVADDPD